MISEKISAFPNNTYYVFPGQNVEFSLSEHLDNSSKCEIITPNVTNTLNDFSSNFTNCLMKIQNVTKEMNGTWTVKGISHVTLFSKVDVIVKGEIISKIYELELYYVTAIVAVKQLYNTFINF